MAVATGKIATGGYEDYVNKKMRRFLNHHSRLNVYNYFFNRSDFSGVMKDCVGGKGVFLVDSILKSFFA